MKLSILNLIVIIVFNPLWMHVSHCETSAEILKKSPTQEVKVHSEPVFSGMEYANLQLSCLNGFQAKIYQKKTTGENLSEYYIAPIPIIHAQKLRQDLEALKTSVSQQGGTINPNQIYPLYFDVSFIADEVKEEVARLLIERAKLESKQAIYGASQIVLTPFTAIRVYAKIGGGEKTVYSWPEEAELTDSNRPGLPSGIARTTSMLIADTISNLESFAKRPKMRTEVFVSAFSVKKRIITAAISKAFASEAFQEIVGNDKMENKVIITTTQYDRPGASINLAIGINAGGAGANSSTVVADRRLQRWVSRELINQSLKKWIIEMSTSDWDEIGTGLNDSQESKTALADSMMKLLIAESTVIEAKVKKDSDNVLAFSNEMIGEVKVAAKGAPELGINAKSTSTRAQSGNVSVTVPAFGTGEAKQATNTSRTDDAILTDKGAIIPTSVELYSFSQEVVQATLRANTAVLSATDTQYNIKGQTIDGVEVVDDVLTGSNALEIASLSGLYQSIKELKLTTPQFTAPTKHELAKGLDAETRGYSQQSDDPSGKTVPIINVREGFAFLSSVEGKFADRNDKIDLFVDDGLWKIKFEGQAGSKAAKVTIVKFPKK